jgi:hypothetical protein
MTTIIEAKKIEAGLKTRLAIETDPLVRELLIDKIRSVSQIIIRESVRISHQREKNSREFTNTQEAKIKCGLRGATGHSLPDKQRHWPPGGSGTTGDCETREKRPDYEAGAEQDQRGARDQASRLD